MDIRVQELPAAALAGAGGDFSRAADLVAAYGSPTFEAEARLCAAEELIGAGQTVGFPHFPEYDS